MKSLLQDGDECTLRNGKTPIVKGTMIFFQMDETSLSLCYYSDDLKREASLGTQKISDYDVMKVTRNGEIIWQRDEPIDINKMATVIHNGITYPFASPENMKILIDRISELEKEISNLKQGGL